MAECEKRPVCIGWDVSILLLFTVLAIIVWWRSFDYLSGVTNRAMEKGLPFGILSLYALLGVLLMSCIAVTIARTARQWKTLPAWGNVVRCGVILLMCAGVMGAFACGGAGIDRFAQGFEKKMRAEVDVKAIRAWASGLTVPVTSGTVPSIPDNLWPGCVKTLSPREVYFLSDVNAVKLDWGGGFIGHYGVVVGPEATALPHTTELELIIRLESGAYLYFPNS